jgi:hypothetical protein
MTGRTVSLIDVSAGSEYVGIAYPWHELRRRTTVIVRYLRMQEIPYTDNPLGVNLYSGYYDFASK